MQDIQNTETNIGRALLFMMPGTITSTFIETFESKNKAYAQVAAIISLVEWQQSNAENICSMHGNIVPIISLLVSSVGMSSFFFFLYCDDVLM